MDFADRPAPRKGFSERIFDDLLGKLPGCTELHGMVCGQLHRFQAAHLEHMVYIGPSLGERARRVCRAVSFYPLVGGWCVKRKRETKRKEEKRKEKEKKRIFFGVGALPKPWKVRSRQ